MELFGIWSSFVRSNSLHDFTNLNYRRTEEKNKAQGAKKQFFRSLIGAASVRRRLNSKVKHTPDAEMSIWDAWRPGADTDWANLQLRARDVHCS